MGKRSGILPRLVFIDHDSSTKNNYGTGQHESQKQKLAPVTIGSGFISPQLPRAPVPLR